MATVTTEAAQTQVHGNEEILERLGRLENALLRISPAESNASPSSDGSYSVIRLTPELSSTHHELSSTPHHELDELRLRDEDSQILDHVGTREDSIVRT